MLFLLKDSSRFTPYFIKFKISLTTDFNNFNNGNTIFKVEKTTTTKNSKERDWEWINERKIQKFNKGNFDEWKSHTDQLFFKEYKINYLYLKIFLENKHNYFLS